jgi:hypothetical protein
MTGAFSLLKSPARLCKMDLTSIGEIAMHHLGIGRNWPVNPRYRKRFQGEESLRARCNVIPEGQRDR